MKLRILFYLILSSTVIGCSGLGQNDDELSDGHLVVKKEAVEPEVKASIPDTVRVSTVLPPPQTAMQEPTHTVVVYDVPVSELLFSLARDSNMNLDIDPEINDTISLNAVEQTLPALLERISQSIDIRYSVRGDVLRVEQDAPFIKNYAVDYLNMSRTSSGTVAVSTQVSSTGAGGEESGGTGNSSDTLVESQTDHAFWTTLRSNIDAILSDGEVDPTAATDTSLNPNIIVNSESGIIAVRATSRQHREVQAFIESVQVSTRRQVLIEATIAEVNLSDRYQAGIDWQLVNLDPTSSGVEANQLLNDVTLGTRPTFNITSTDLDLGGNQLTATLAALETFGDVTVMSSPKVMALNNQTALLKVVDNLIYFTVEVNIDTSSTVIGGGNLTTFETEVNTVPVGFVMSVTPFIDESSTVILNVRPTISRVIDFVQDPNPALADANVVSEIPVIQVREVESVLKVNSGDIAVIGGLMQDELTKNQRGVPFLASVPGLGRAFRYDDNLTKKTELVIFLKPTVVTNASITGELSKFENFLPSVN